MKYRIDIHSHILPGVDDGADSLETSLHMLKTAQENQIAQIILTPHNKPGRRNVLPEHIAERAGRLQSTADENGMDIRLYPGNELYYRDGLARELDEGKAMTLAGSRYVLVEFSPSTEYDYIRNGIYSLQMGGYLPILAHAERYRGITLKPERAGELAGMGCYIQVNAGSVTGQYGFGTKQFVRKLLKRRLVHFIATDAHDMDRRKPELAACGSYVLEKYGREYAEELLSENPQRVIHDQYIT